MQMQDLLTAEELRHHRSLVKLAEDNWAVKSVHWERDQVLPDDVIDWCAREGLLGAMLPREIGGLGLTFVELGLLYEAFSRVSASLASLVNVHGMVARTVLKWGTEKQRGRVLPDLAAGRRLAAVSITEHSSGSDLSGIETRLEHRPGGLFLTGTKLYTTFGQRADLFLILAAAADGQVLCLVDRETPGLRTEPITDLLGLRAAGLARVELRDCPVDPEFVIGRPGFAQMVLVPHALEHGRHAVAWMAAGMLALAVELCAAWAHRRQAFGRSLADLGQVQSIITEMTVDLAAARGLCISASRALEAGEPEATRSVLMAKYFACRALERHAPQAVQVLGAFGCLEDNGVARLYRDSKVLAIIEGSTQLLERLLAPHIAQAAAAARAS
jgi:alkylation response protein AidB-like acyl-CoA dehydrogenase